MHSFRFRSAMFPIDPREDEETNPFCYGKSLAQWLRGKLAEQGYTPEEVIPEDFGWCVMLSRGSGMLWVGCGNERSHLYEEVSSEAKATFVPDAQPVDWHVFVATDKPMWSLNFAKRRAAIQRLAEAATSLAVRVESILKAEPRIELQPDDA